MRYVFLAVALVAAGQVFGQVDANRFTNIVESVGSGNAAYGSGFKGRFVLDGKVKGSPYRDTTFVPTTFNFHKGTTRLSGPSRYDLYNNEIEVKTTAGVRVLANGLVKSYRSYIKGDSVLFVNAENYSFDGTKLIGFLKVLADGKVQLLEMYKLEIIKPTYNASLEVGDRNTHLKTDASLLYSKDGELFKVKGKKEVLALFAPQKEKMNAYISANKIDLKEEKDLVLAFDYFNSLN
jgi:hypothetical protein